MSADTHDTAGAWAKRLHLTSRTVMEALLRPHGLGSTQWYVLYQLANYGPTPQRDFLTLLQVEKPTLSEVVAALVRKGLVDQKPDPADQRQRVLVISKAGTKLWRDLPDVIDVILKTAFHDTDKAELETTRRVLQKATQHLNDYLKGMKT